MDYKLEDLETQIVWALSADPNLYPACTIRTYAGELSGLVFDDMTKMQGQPVTPPFIFVEYNGKIKTKSTGRKDVVIHRPKFRFYVGAESLRSASELSLTCYAMLRSIFDDLHGKFFNYSGATGYAATNNLGGTAISLNGMQQQESLNESDGEGEGVLFVLPRLAVYVTHYDCQLLTG